MKILYLDESGSSNLKAIDKNYPIFILGGILVDSADLEFNDDLVNAFKKKYFKSLDIILHWSEISHCSGHFCQLRNVKNRKKFNADLDNLFSNLKFKVIVCLIDKKKWIAKYDWHAIDPYRYALEMLINKCISFVDFSEKIDILAEARDKKADEQIKSVFNLIKTMGTLVNSSGKIKAKIKKFGICKKTDNIIGLQIADLVLSPIGRHYLSKSTDNYAPSFEVIDQKIMPNGFVKLPYNEKNKDRRRKARICPMGNIIAEKAPKVKKKNK